MTRKEEALKKLTELLPVLAEVRATNHRAFEAFDAIQQKLPEYHRLNQTRTTLWEVERQVSQLLQDFRFGLERELGTLK